VIATFVLVAVIALCCGACSAYLLNLFLFRRWRGVSPESKAVLSILIRELQGCLERPPEDAVREIRHLIKLWVEANDLHPEKVITLKKESDVA